MITADAITEAGIEEAAEEALVSAEVIEAGTATEEAVTVTADPLNETDQLLPSKGNKIITDLHDYEGCAVVFN
jgi:hypothetical protein